MSFCHWHHQVTQGLRHCYYSWLRKTALPSAQSQVQQMTGAQCYFTRGHSLAATSKNPRYIKSSILKQRYKTTSSLDLVRFSKIHYSQSPRLRFLYTFLALFCSCAVASCQQHTVSCDARSRARARMTHGRWPRYFFSGLTVEKCLKCVFFKRQEAQKIAASLANIRLHVMFRQRDFSTKDR